MRVACIIFFAAITLISCTKVENNYFVYTDGEWIQVDENPMTDEETKNDPDVKSDEDKIIIDDGEITVPDESSVDKENEDPDEDVFADYCISVVDIHGNDITGEYKDNPSDSEETTLSIELVSIQKEKTCQIVFTSYYYPVLEEIIIKTTTLPVKRYLLKYNNDDCYFFFEFLDIYNTLYMRLVRISDGTELLDRKFSRK